MSVRPRRVAIRDARDDDCDAVRDVVLRAYAEYASMMPERLWMRYRQQLLDTLDSVVSVERIVAERTGALVGSVLLFPPAAAAYGSPVLKAEYPEVRLLAVLPEARGRGIGAALMEDCAERARRAGASTLGLHTTEIMQAALRMYERLGYVRAPEHDFVPAPGILVKGYRLDLRITRRT
jgi:GNAT superfamily N-acetyltransferase